MPIAEFLFKTNDQYYSLIWLLLEGPIFRHISAGPNLEQRCCAANILEFIYILLCFVVLCFIVLYSGSCVTLHRIQKITSPSNCLFAASQKLCRDIFCKDAAKKTPLFAQRVNIFGSDKAGNSLIINTSPFHNMPCQRQLSF